MRLAPVSWRKIDTFLRSKGFYLHHQKGSHLVYRHQQDISRSAVVPRHESVKVGTLRSIFRQAGIPPEEWPGRPAR